MDKLNIDKANIVGFSMGGSVALYMAARYPNIIKSLKEATITEDR